MPWQIIHFKQISKLLYLKSCLRQDFKSHNITSTLLTIIIMQIMEILFPFEESRKIEVIVLFNLICNI